jgi:hypothetical protein
LSTTARDARVEESMKDREVAKRFGSLAAVRGGGDLRNRELAVACPTTFAAAPREVGCAGCLFQRDAIAYRD